MSIKTKKLFGTDGIRGIAGTYPLDRPTVMAIGAAAADVLKTKTSHGHPVIIGRDTRQSSPRITHYLQDALSAHHIDVWDAGVIPTPGIAYLVKKYPALAGIVVSASHNPYEHNGIKFFNHRGIKLEDQVEHKIEKRIAYYQSRTITATRVSHRKNGRFSLADEYRSHLSQGWGKGFNLRGLKVVIDCAHGAASYIAPALFDSLGADVIAINCTPNGININTDCGSLHPEGLAQHVRKHRAHCGFAFDGDSDRVMSVDETGAIRDGDYMLGMMARYLKKKTQLTGNLLVTTVMANIGLIRAMEESKIQVSQTAVGDRYVYEEMKKRGATLGGEQSGHIILMKHLPTGDGMLSALLITAIMREQGLPLSSLCSFMTKYPQVLINAPVPQRVPLATLGRMQKEITAIERRLKKDGRVLVRYSGTENLLRVMIEGKDKREISQYAQQIADTAVKEIAGTVS